jgi:hypothetical protein
MGHLRGQGDPIFCCLFSDGYAVPPVHNLL